MPASAALIIIITLPGNWAVMFATWVLLRLGGRGREGKRAETTPGPQVPKPQATRHGGGLRAKGLEVVAVTYPQTFADWERWGALPREAFASAAWHTGPLCTENIGYPPPCSVGQTSLPPWPPHSVVTCPCAYFSYPQDHPLWLPALGRYGFGSHSNHPP